MEASSGVSINIGGYRFVYVSNIDDLEYSDLVFDIPRIQLEYVTSSKKNRVKAFLYCADGDTKSLLFLRKILLSDGFETTNKPEELLKDGDEKLYKLAKSSSNGDFVFGDFAHLVEYNTFYWKSFLNRLLHRGISIAKFKIDMISDRLKAKGVKVWQGRFISYSDYPLIGTEVIALNNQIHVKDDSVLVVITRVLKELVKENSAGLPDNSSQKIAKLSPAFAELVSRGFKLVNEFGAIYIITKDNRKIGVDYNSRKGYYVDSVGNELYFNNPTHKEIIDTLLENKNV